VGSPDVSDFAEIVLAKTHGIKPYHHDRVKQTGYVIIKDEAGEGPAPSSHYWTTHESERVGVAKLSATGQEAYPARLDPKTGEGEMCGVLAVASNPFSDLSGRPEERRVVLLSGFSGVATNAIAKFLTDDNYLDEFAKFDRDYVDVNKNVEVLIGVNFSGALGIDGDGRTIQRIWYRGMVVV